MKRTTPKLGFLSLFLGSIFLILGFAGLEYAGPGLFAPEVVDVYLNNNFPAGPENTAPYEEAYPNLTFNTPLNYTTVPNQNKIVVGQRNGEIFWFDNDDNVATKQMLLDLSNEVGVVWDGGFLGLSIHPEFDSGTGNNYFYIYYTTKDSNGNNFPDFVGTQSCDSEDFWGNYLMLERFEVNPGDFSFVANSRSTLIKLRMYGTTHRGGGMVFGDDGYLYLTTGDQTAFRKAQDPVNNLDGGVLRLDVDQDPTKSHAPIRTMPEDLGEADEITGQGYWIPNDNPFLSPDGSRFEEYYTIGHRNPHRMTKDRLTGEMYIGEVGGSKHDEINKVVAGSNYGWPFFEGLDDGTGCEGLTSMYENMDHEEPLVAFPRAEANSITGGYVYRGTNIPGLYGRYICADYGTGEEIWSVDPNTGQYSLIGNFLPANVVSFGEDYQGELYMLKQGTNVKLYRLIPNGVNLDEVPQLLSETGAFTDLTDMTPASGLIPYEMIDPFWSDGAYKKRWIVIPNDGTHDTPEEQIQFSENGVWEFPIGSVLIKHFEYPIDERDPSITKKIETRFSIRGSDGNFYYLTYNWNEAQTDAVLQETGLDEPIQVTTLDGGTRTDTWHYPSESECLACHNSASKGTLGARTRYLNRSIVYEKTGVEANQLVTLSHLGIIPEAIDDITTEGYLTHSSINDQTKSVEDRARSYMDLNCAYCHRPQTGIRGNFDLRLINSLAQTNLLGAQPNNSLGIPGESILIPGDTARSILYQRVHSIDPAIMMPPLSKNRVDEQGVALLEEWILNLEAPQDVENGRYVITNKASGLSMEVVGGGVSFGVNLAQATYSGVNYQQFELVADGNGYFDIKPLHSNKSLDVEFGSTQPGANVQQWNSNGSDAQLWQIVNNFDGSFGIVSKLSGHYMGIDAASGAEGANISVLAQDGSDNQKWLFTSIDNPDILISSNTVTTDESGASDTFDVRLTVEPTSDVVIDVIKGGNADEFNVDVNQLVFTPANWDQPQTVTVMGEDDPDVDGDISFGLTLSINDPLSADEYDNVVTQNISGVNQDNDTNILEDGVYILRNKNSGLTLSIAGGGINIGDNIVQDDFIGQLFQQFEITSVGGDEFSIRAFQSGLKVDVAGGVGDVGDNIQQWDENLTDAQIWEIVEAEPGYYYLVNRAMGNYLSVAGESTAAEANVELSAPGTLDSQKWSFESLTPLQVEAGSYYFTNLQTGGVIEVENGDTNFGANIQQGAYQGSTFQHFRLVPDGEGYFEFRPQHSNKAVDMEGGEILPGTNVLQWTPNLTDAQKWRVLPTGDGYYFLINKRVSTRFSETDISLHLGVAKSSPDPGANIAVFYNTGTRNFKWTLTQVSDTPIPDGVYALTNKASGLNMEVEGGSLDLGADVVQNTYTEQTYQQFSFVANGSAQYQISPIHSGSIVDVSGGAANPGDNVQQWVQNGTNAQLWTIEPDGNGYFRLVSVAGNTMLGVDGASTSSGASLTVQTPDGSDNQLWLFTPVERPEDPALVISKINVTTSEVGATDTFDVVLNQEPTADVVVDLTKTQAPDEFNLDLNQLTFTSTNWDQPQTVTVSGIDDGIQDGDAPYQITVAINDALSDDLFDAVGDVNIAGINFDDETTDPDDIEAGIYILTNKASGLAMEVENGDTNFGANVAQNTFDGLLYQQFSIQPNGLGYYTIDPVHSGRTLDIEDGSALPGANVRQWSANGSDAQQWEIIPAGDGSYNIVSKVGSNYIGIDNASSAPGANISVLLADGSDNQKWLLTSLADQAIVESTFVISNKNSTLTMQVDGASQAFGANVIQGTNEGETHQQFAVVSDGQGYFEIRAVHSDKVLDLAGGDPMPDTNVQQWEPNASDAQKWEILPTGDGHYYIKSKFGGNFLSIENASVASGGNVNVQLVDYTDNQKWLFTDLLPPNQPPVAVADADVLTGDATLTVNFTGSNSTDDSGIVDYSWDFGDGVGTSSDADPSYDFTTPGVYTVTLTVTDAETLSDSATLEITVLVPNEAPVALAEADVVEGEAPLTVTFTGENSTDDRNTIVSYSWDFGDGVGTSNDTNPVYNFQTPGVYTVTLIVTDAEGLTGQSTIDITVIAPNEAPVAVAEADITSGDAPLTVTFTGENSTDDRNTIVSYSWDFGDGLGTSSETNPVYEFQTPGVYTVTLIVTDAEGLTGQTTVDITVLEPNQAPVAVAEADITSGDAPLTVAFTGENSTDDRNSIVSYSWDFGDGVGTSTETNPVYEFQTPGVYTVVLTVTDVEGLSGSAQIDITVGNDEPPVALASANPTMGEAPLAVIFDGSGSTDDNGIVSYAWDFKDGTTSAEINPVTTFDTPGQYDVELTVTDTSGQTDTDIVTIIVESAATNEAPVAVISSSSTGGEAPITIDFDGSGSTDDTGIVEYLWDFGNGATSDEITPSTTYTQVGEFVVTLLVTDEGGLTNQSSVTITVTAPADNEPPTAVAQVDPTEGVAPLTVSYDATGSTDDNGIVAYMWDFDNGELSDSAQGSIVFDQPGIYNIQLEVFDEEGLSGQTTVQIIVNNPNGNEAPVSRISANPLSGNAPLEVDFIGSASTDDVGIVSYSWDFADGTTGTNVNETHLYTVPGVYIVTLTVEDNEGLTDSETVEILVLDPNNTAPIAQIAASSIFAQAPATIEFSSSASSDDKGIISYAWDFGDGGTSSLTNPSHEYTFGGIFEVTLTVTDLEGLTDSETILIEITDNTTSSVDDIEAILYPNPVRLENGVLVLEMAQVPANMVPVQLYMHDSSGKLIRSMSPASVFQDGAYRIPLWDLRSGLYHLSVKFNTDEIISRTFLKSN